MAYLLCQLRLAESGVLYVHTAQETAPDNFTTSEPDYTELDGNDTSTSEDAIQTPTSDNATIAVSTYNSIVTEGGSTSSMDFGTVRDNNSPSTVGAIVGGVIGGVVALTLLVVIIAALVIRKKRKTRKPVQAHCSSDYYLYNSAYGQGRSITTYRVAIVTIYSIVACSMQVIVFLYTWQMWHTIS